MVELHVVQILTALFVGGGVGSCVVGAFVDVYCRRLTRVEAFLIMVVGAAVTTLVGGVMLALVAR